jgi:uncharacterized membrane protein YagU involved in acid resistance
MLGQSVDFLFVLAVGLIAGTVSGIVGAGSSIMLVPRPDHGGGRHHGQRLSYHGVVA